MSKTVVSGKCCICGHEKVLTFEHVPPQSAYNNGRAYIVDGEEMVRIIAETKTIPVDFKNAQYQISQKGIGDYTLCKECNDKTGGWYVKEYSAVMHVLHYFIANNNNTDSNCVEVRLPYLRPLNFVKQVLAMFCSVSKGSLIERYPEISELLLNKDAHGIDYSKFKVSMCLLKNGNQELAGPTAFLLEDGKIRVLSMIKTYPAYFILEEKPLGYEDGGLDITRFFEAQYNEIRPLAGPMPYYDLPSPFPGFYKSGVDFRLQSL